MDQDRDIELIDIIRAIKNNFKLFVIVFLAVFAAGLISYFTGSVKNYESTIFIEVAKSDKLPVEKAANLEAVFKSPMNPFSKMIAKDMGYDDGAADQIASKIDFSDKSEDYICIRSEGGTPEEAKKLNAIVAKYAVERENKIVNDAVSALDTEIASIKGRLAAIGNEIKECEQKMKEKDNTTNTAQASVYQSIIAYKNGLYENSAKLSERLTEITNDRATKTKPAAIVNEDNVHNKFTVRKSGALVIVFLSGLILALFVVLIKNYFDKNPL